MTAAAVPLPEPEDDALPEPAPVAAADASRTPPRKRLDTLELVRLPEATAFDDDPLLDNPDYLIRVLRSYPELVEPLERLTRVPVEAAPTFDLDKDDLRLPAPRVPECSRTGELSVAPDDLEGRPRMPGNWMLAYLHYVAHKKRAVRDWWKKTEEPTWIELFGFTRKPCYSETALRFRELEMLERHRGALHGAQRYLVRNARKYRPEIGVHVSFDGTAVLTRARLHHCCTSADACEAAGGNPPRIIERADQELVNDTRREELDDPNFDPDAAPRGACTFIGVRNGRAYYKVKGHLYSSLDTTAGLRSYSSGKRKTRGWLGSVGCTAVDRLTDGGLAAEAISADTQEYDAWPMMLEQLCDLLGEMPYTASFDGLSCINKVYELNTRAGVATVAPGKKRGKMNREEWRTQHFDEHGIPRCRHCGGEGTFDGPKLGLTFVRGEPVLRFRCLLRHTKKCAELQHIDCSKDWRLLTPLSRKTLLYHALRRGHKPFEHIHGHWRQRYRVFGKDKGGMLQVTGTPAQRLRAKASLVIEWLRINLRHGWLGNHPVRNLGGVRIDTHLGAERLASVLRARRRRGLNLPYGPRAVHLGLAPPPT